MRKIFNAIVAGVQAVKEKFVAVHAAAERRIHRISAKIRTAAFRLAIRSNAMLALELALLNQIQIHKK